MKTLSILGYIIGSILLIISCFTTGVTVTWVLGGAAVVFLILGCVFQFNATSNHVQIPHRPSHEV
ncbi:MAG: hypothetical protein HDT02_05940 [Bacteroidales bacterium]|nr:hypothetical protein [Bacteroidales bacterium]MDE6230348.1 hypothetical protein [Muribaculaceae bacterium]